MLNGGLMLDDEDWPPATRINWVQYLLFVALIAATVVPGLAVRFFGKSPELRLSVPDALVLSSSALLCVCVYLRYLHRPARVLDAALRKAGYEPVLTSSSPELVATVQELTGIRLVSRWARSGAFLACVNTGPTLELWRWRHGRVECVARIPWQRFTSWAYGTVTFAHRTDRAIVLSLRVTGQDVVVPICPQTIGPIGTGAARDVAFGAAVDLVRRRVAQHNHMGAEPGFEEWSLS